jgi:release factor glutamine methyltransferase
VNDVRATYILKATDRSAQRNHCPDLAKMSTPAEKNKTPAPWTSAPNPPVTKLPHVNMGDLAARGVYEPSEDTFLLIDALRADLAARDHSPRTNFPATVCIEIGPGSGVVSCALAQALLDRETAGEKGEMGAVVVIAADVSAAACAAVRETASLNGLSHCIEAVQSDLTSASRDMHQFPLVRGGADIVVFNPPYVPCEAETLSDIRDAVRRKGRENNEEYTSPDSSSVDVVDAAWAGGVNGREVLDAIFDSAFPELVAPGGHFYLLLERENRPTAVIRKLERLGFDVVPIARRRASNEDLSIVRAHRRV